MPYKNIEDERAYRRARYHRTKVRRKDAILDSKIRSRHSISKSQYDEMLEEQGGRCFICARTVEENGKKLAVDHDHKCCDSISRSCGGCIRALLCFSCNVILGHCKDNPELLKDLAEYVEWFGGDRL